MSLGFFVLVGSGVSVGLAVGFAVGLAVGVLLALGFGRALSSILFEVPGFDPVTFFGVAAILAVVSVLAGLVPARRALRVEPMVALRYD